MKKLLLATCVLAVLHAGAQQYWQQQVNYRINVTLDEKAKTLRGNESIEYINHSPDELRFIWFHIWPNAYRDKSTAFAKQLNRDEEGIKRWNEFKNKGYIDSLKFTVDGVAATTEADPENPDVIKVMLPAPLKSGGKAVIETPFFVRLPEYISRSGYSGNTFMVCQWYPKPAVYDRKGWHPMPYLDQGEFYSDFGRFEVSITVPSGYIVGATGILQNQDELQQYKQIGQSNVARKASRNTIKYKAPAASVKTLTYVGENVVDFAWFADDDFVIRYDTLQQASGVVDVFTFHHPDGNANWTKSTSMVKEGTRAYANYLGEYAYPVVQAVEGPKNVMSGGMEYPMITLITSPEASMEMLDAVLAHEVGHNWLQGVIATNERLHAWLDEGLNTYYQFRYEAGKYRYNSIFGNDIPESVRKLSLEDFQATVYSALSKIPMEEKIDMHAASYSSKDSYGLVTYLKTSIWMYLLELELGREAVDRSMRSYYNEWKFRHPYPEDLKAVFEKETGKSLAPYFELLSKTGNL